ncbi:MAG: carboxypeptidase-like regulatory domain-containing protein [Cyclobacteriaceae bacterium]|nr:carboxypeptidase-like regulatory domain-containing protein [Cyclobacteriaceae bacterium]
MKKLTLALFTGLALLSIPCRAQVLPGKRMTIQVQDQTLTSVLAEIENKSGVRFSYNPRKIQSDRKITFIVTNESIQDVLDALSEQAGLQYALIENQIILSPQKKSESEAVPLTYSGYVKDQVNGEALIGATLYLKQLQTGTVTNSYGFFSLSLPKGNYEISVSYIGFQSIHKTVDLQVSLREDLVLKEDLPILEEVLVTDQAEESIAETQVSKINLRPKSIEERPALFGENDVIKSLESVPGIKFHSDGSTFYYVRGGNRDQNLVLIDDSPIYNPSHLLGLFSTIIPDAATDITLYKGNMPASFGGRLSSVLDVHTRKGNDQFTQVWGNVGLISTKLGIEGPLKKERSSFLLSGRFSRLKWLFQMVDDRINQFGFHDLTGKMNFKLNSKNHAYFSFYTGSDNYFAGNNGIKWTNTAGTIRWTHLYSERLFINTTFSASGYDYFLYTNVSSNQRWNSHISNVNLKSDFSYFIKPENEVSFGLGVNGYNFNPGNVTTNNVQNSNVSARHSLEFLLYGNQDLKLNSRWGLNYGLRFTSWTNYGEAFEFKFDENHNPVDTLIYPGGESYINFINAEPRLTIQYLINNESSIKAGYARNVQNVHLISNSISPFTSLEVWLPSSFNIQPQRSNQVTLGYYHLLSTRGISLSGEVFGKIMQNQIDFETHAETLLNPFFESELRFGQARSYGFELLAKKELGRIRGLAGYTFSRVSRTFPDLNQGRSYNALFDRPHQLNITMSYDLNLKWTVSANWNLLSGAPYSSPVSFYQYNGLEVPVYGQKNNDRLPSYHRLDVTANLKLNKNPENKFKHDLTFSIFNLYGRKNPLFVNFNKEEVSYRDFKVPANLLESQYAISQFYLFQVTPCISYNFRWR